MMYAAGVIGVLAALAIALARACLGPTVYDRILAANTIGTLAVSLMALYGFLTGRPEFLDIAIVYAFLNVLSTLAVLKFFRFGSLGDPEPGVGE
jgi:multicomponent Na+:H+ antiporter subunit F